MKQKLFSLVFVSLILYSGILEILGNVGADQQVTFPDENLEEVLREKIGKFTGPIYTNDLENIVELMAEGKNIKNIEGLEYCRNLKQLDLSENNISDIYPLTNLTGLRELYLFWNNISDIYPLTNLTDLEILYLSWNNISDIYPLTNLTGLRELYLYGSNISDISPLTNLTGLEILDISGSNISDISPLTNLTGLEILDISGNNISDISLLASLTDLRELYLYGNNISDISPLTNLTGLRELELNGNNISDISLLTNLTGLEALDLSWNNISDIYPLTNLTDLDTLYLSGNNISDIYPLTNLTDLEALRLSDNNISDIYPLTNLTDLEWLHLSENNISDISPLTNLTDLDTLDLNGNNISDISPLTNLTDLDTLDLSDNNISDIHPLGGLFNLSIVRLQRNYIKDVTPLEALVNIGNHGIPWVGTYLNLSFNQISDISSLVENTGIDNEDTVDISYNLLNRESIDFYVGELENRGVEVVWEPVVKPDPDSSDKRKKILFDSWHLDSYIDISTLTEELENAGHYVNYLNSEISSSRLEKYDVFVVYFLGVDYSGREKNALYKFVEKGGGLLIIGEVGSYLESRDILSKLNDLSNEFGIQFNADCVNDPSDNMPVSGCAQSKYPIIYNIEDHAVTGGITEFFLGWGSSLECEGSAFVLARGDQDTFSDENDNDSYDSDERKGEEIIVLAGHNYGKGKVIVIGDSSLWSGKSEERLDEELISYLDNKELALNIFDWLSQDITTRKLIFLCFGVFITAIICILAIYSIRKKKYEKEIVEKEKEKPPVESKKDERTKITKKLTCPLCKNEIQEDWAACPHCGTRLKDDTRIY